MQCLRLTVPKSEHSLTGVKRLWGDHRQYAEMLLPNLDTCIVQKGPACQSWTPMWPYLMEAPVGIVGVDIFGPFPGGDAGNCAGG